MSRARAAARVEAEAEFAAQLAAAQDAASLEREEMERQAIADLEAAKATANELVAKVQASAAADAYVMQIVHCYYHPPPHPLFPRMHTRVCIRAWRHILMLFTFEDEQEEKEEK